MEYNPATDPAVRTVRAVGIWMILNGLCLAVLLFALCFNLGAFSRLWVGLVTLFALLLTISVPVTWTGYRFISTSIQEMNREFTIPIAGWMRWGGGGDRLNSPAAGVYVFFNPFLIVILAVGFLLDDYRVLLKPSLLAVILVCCIGCFLYALKLSRELKKAVSRLYPRYT